MPVRNSVKLIGRLSQDIYLDESDNGTTYANFTIAVNRVGQDEDADFIDCVAFGKTAENLDEYKSKGDIVALNGAIRVNSYQDDGEWQQEWSVLAQNIDYMFDLGGESSGSSNNSGNATSSDPDDILDDVDIEDDSEDFDF